MTCVCRFTLLSALCVFYCVVRVAKQVFEHLQVQQAGKAQRTPQQRQAPAPVAMPGGITIPLPKPRENPSEGDPRAKGRKGKQNSPGEEEAQSKKGGTGEEEVKARKDEEGKKKKKSKKEGDDKKDEKHVKESRKDSEKAENGKEREPSRRGEEKDKKRKEKRERGRKKEAADVEEEGPRIQDLLTDLAAQGFEDSVRNTCLLSDNNMNLPAVMAILVAEKEATERAARLQAELMHLDSKGFCDTIKNTRLLQENDMDANKVVGLITAEREAYRASLMAQEQKMKVPTIQLGFTTRKGQGHACNEDREVHVDLRESLTPEALRRLGGSEGMWLWAVFDGHGGHVVSEYSSGHLVEFVAQELEDGECTIPDALVKAFKHLEDDILKAQRETGEDSGTCAVCVVVCGTEVHSAHVGDCRAIVASGITSSGDMAAKLTSAELTHDHRGNYPGEKERIAEVGGKMIDGRVNGGLIPSRTLGDSSHKNLCPGAVIAEPTTGRYDLQRSDLYIVLASDGLWDDMTNDRAAGVVRKSTKAQAAAEALSREVAKKYGGKHMDDFTTLVIRLLHS